MKQGLTLEAMAGELDRQRQAKRDFLLDTRSMEFAVEEGGVQLQVELPGNGLSRLPLRKTAHQQFASTLGIPKIYYDRMGTDAPDLLATNLNHWLQTQPKRRMLRTLDGQVRALLSDKYRPLDNHDLAEAVLPKLMELEATVQSTAITEDRFYLKAVTERIQGEVKKGDVVQAGLVVSNSEVGAGRLLISALDYRLVCLNGMISERAIRKTHLGRGYGDDDFDNAREFFRDETKLLEDKAFWNKVVDVTSSMFVPELFNKRLLKYQEAADVVLEDPIEAVKEISNRFGFQKGEEKSVLKALIRGRDMTKWGLANAVTQVSQSLDDYDRATDFETFGGRIIELSPVEWGEVEME